MPQVAYCTRRFSFGDGITAIACFIVSFLAAMNGTVINYLQSL